MLHDHSLEPPEGPAVASAFILSPILGHRRLGRPRNRLVQCSETLLGIIHAIHDGIARDDLGVRFRRVFGELLDHCRLRNFRRTSRWNTRPGARWRRSYAVDFPLKVLPQ